MIDAAAVLMIGSAIVLTVLPTAAMVIAYLFRRLESQERLKAIEQGHLLAFDPQEIALRTRRSGIACIAAGLGILAAIVIAARSFGDDMLGGLGLGVIPLFIGVGLMVDYRMQVRRIKEGAK